MGNQYNAVNVANYILWIINNDFTNIKDVTNLKLQKILYYVAATYYKQKNTLLFNEPIEKWKYGPVVATVYQTFKSYSYDHIRAPAPTYHIEDGSLTLITTPFDPKLFEDDISLKECIIRVIKEIGELSSFKLVERTHKEAAWLNSAPSIFSGTKHLSYTNDELKEALI